MEKALLHKKTAPQQPATKRKVTDFSIKAIMAERDNLQATFTETPAAGTKVHSSEAKVARKTATPLSEPEIPDTTTSDDVLPLPSLQKEKPVSVELLNVQCHLEMKELWEKFMDLGTEMIITRSGRRMFPTLRVSFSGLDGKATYLVLIDIVTIDNKRYRYAYHRSSWLVAGKGDPAHSSKLYCHPDSPFSGDQLRKQIVTFEKVKLTNTEVNKPGYIVLNSMHRFQPRIHLVLDKGEDNLMKSLKSHGDLDNYDHKTFIFPECAFYSVTAYQNQLITKLKIDCNPFAKGFRDSTRVISDMERESMNNGIPDHYHPYASQNDVLNCDMEAAIFSQKLAHYSRMMQSNPESPMMYPNYKPYCSPAQTSIPMNILQKWTLTSWPGGVGLDQQQLSSAAAGEFSRQLLLAKHFNSTASFHPYFALEQPELIHKLKEASAINMQ